MWRSISSLGREETGDFAHAQRDLLGQELSIVVEILAQTEEWRFRSLVASQRVLERHGG